MYEGGKVMTLACPRVRAPGHGCDLEPSLSLMEFNRTVTFWRNYFYKSVKHLKDSNFQ